MRFFCQNKCSFFCSSRQVAVLRNNSSNAPKVQGHLFQDFSFCSVHFTPETCSRWTMTRLRHCTVHELWRAYVILFTQCPVSCRSSSYRGSLPSVSSPVTPDMQTLREGVKNMAGRLSSMASDMYNSIPVSTATVLYLNFVTTLSISTTCGFSVVPAVMLEDNDVFVAVARRWWGSPSSLKRWDLRSLATVETLRAFQLCLSTAVVRLLKLYLRHLEVNRGRRVPLRGERMSRLRRTFSRNGTLTKLVLSFLLQIKRWTRRVPGRN